MSERNKAQWVVSGIVKAPVERVWAAMLETNPLLSDGDRAAIARGGQGTFTMSKGEHLQGKITVEVDARRHSIATQGEWWYRGVFSVEPHAEGSCVRYAVFNIAPGLGWWAAQLVQGPQNAKDMGRQLEEVLRGLGKQLEVETLPVR